MRRSTAKVLLAVTAVTALSLSVPAISHYDDKEMHQSYLQSYFALLAANFGPMVSSVKGEIPWDQTKMENWANDLSALSTLDIMRGFVDGSDKGTTRAKPDIWDNKADFTSKMENLHKELASLQQVTAGGDRKAIAEQVGAAGKACKACHDDYKSKNYLY